MSAAPPKSVPFTNVTPACLRACEQLRGVDAAELEPEEVAALGTRRLTLGQLAVERREHRVAARAEQPVDALEVRLEAAAADELVHRRLAEQHRA